MKQSELVLKTIQKIIKQGTRAYTKDNIFTCTYENEKGHHCAVGIWFSKEQIAELKRLGAITEAAGSAFKHLGIKRFLGKSLRFWIHLQNLHDTSSYWIETPSLKLSKMGIDFVKLIFNLDVTPTGKLKKG